MKRRLSWPTASLDDCKIRAARAGAREMCDEERISIAALAGLCSFLLLQYIIFVRAVQTHRDTQVTAVCVSVCVSVTCVAGCSTSSFERGGGHCTGQARQNYPAY